MIARRAALVCLCSLAGCKRGQTVMMANADVSVAPGTLDFGALPVGDLLPLTVEVRNSGLAPSPLALTADGPFALEASPPASLAGGSSLTVTVTFSPLQLGAASGTLALGPGLPTVALLGVGVAPCVASEVCRVSRFDLTARACIEDAAPEGALCTAPCLAGAGTCRGGYCLGNATRCVDGDACTLDACGLDGGCFHPPLQCPVEACQSAFCDPVGGCGARAVDDGIPCGEAICEGANICFSGRCQFRVRPNALLDCRYTALSAGPNHTCAVTRGHDLRCWGANDFDQLGRGHPQRIASPGFAVGLSEVRSVATAARTTWVSREPGQLAQSNGPVVHAIDATGLAAGLAGEVCGLERGTVRCAATDGGISDVATGVVALSMSEDTSVGTLGELCVVEGDGGVRCGLPGALTDVSTPAAATAVSSAKRGTGCALLGDRGWCWGALIADGGAAMLWDGGVTALTVGSWSGGGFGPIACAAQQRRVDCRGNEPFLQVQNSLPAPVVGLAAGRLHVCALLDDGKVMCWGGDTSGELGDRFSQPLGVQLRTEVATWVGAVELAVLYEANGQTWAIDRASGTLDDAGAFRLETYPSPLDGERDGYEHGCRCARSDGGVYCFGIGPLPGGMPQACVRARELPRRPVCVGEGAAVHCYQGVDGGVLEVSAWDAGDEVRALSGTWSGGMCALRADGTVRCQGLASPVAPESLSGVSQLCLGDEDAGGGCARLDGGAVRCWGPWVGSAMPVAPSGSWPIARSVVCGAQHACLLSGINIVQCWGNDEHGQLGLDGPMSTRAITVPMPEPVRSIAAAYQHTCALLESGHLACWGDNSFSQLGLANINNSPAPRLVRE